MRAHVYTQTATVATLVGWQINKANSRVCHTSVLHRRQKGCALTLIDNYEYVGMQMMRSQDLFCKTNPFEATDRSGNHHDR